MTPSGCGRPSKPATRSSSRPTSSGHTYCTERTPRAANRSAAAPADAKPSSKEKLTAGSGCFPRPMRANATSGSRSAKRRWSPSSRLSNHVRSKTWWKYRRCVAGRPRSRSAIRPPRSIAPTVPKPALRTLARALLTTSRGEDVHRSSRLEPVAGDARAPFCSVTEPARPTDSRLMDRVNAICHETKPKTFTAANPRAAPSAPPR